MSDQTRPLDKTWWKLPTVDVPADDVPLLAPYELTMPGFELLFADPIQKAQNIEFQKVDGFFRVCVWNIWWNKPADPAAEDIVRQRINHLQQEVGIVSDDDRYIRLQIACLKRCFYTFPGNVNLVIDGIACGKVDLSDGIGCEPPWTALLPILRRRQMLLVDRGIAHRHADQGVGAGEDVRRRLIETYSSILSWWCTDGKPDVLQGRLPDAAGLVDLIYRRLGEPARLKWLQVKRLCTSLEFWGVPALDRSDRWQRYKERTNYYTEAIKSLLEGSDDTVGKLVDRNDDNGSCHHAFFRHVDHIIAYIGAGSPVAFDDAGQEHKRIVETLTTYIHVLGSWLAKRTLAETIAVWPECEPTATDLFAHLGESSPRKKWLVACLWKHLNDDDRRQTKQIREEHPERFSVPLKIQ
ncbi:MAG: hypothetical protein WC869_09695 [Phycisphaerae bacterium]|jgi:hypothetical protein